jgi:glycosyltransferase involved in cell wall biosynthesis
VFEVDQTNNNILLLNSDTELTPNAVEELQAVLDIADRHLAVCPRSNQATILSFPRGQSYSAELSYSLWRDHHQSLPRYQAIPTFVGFCVLIRRSLIGLFGLFDPVYGRGYNEENDFATRANRFGYSSIAANHAFVFHHEGKSFGREREKLEAHNQAILRKRYPEYSRTDSFWCTLQMSLSERFCRAPSLVHRVLIDLTQMPSIHNGSSVYCLQIIKELASKLGEDVALTVWINPAASVFHSDSLRVVADIRLNQPAPEECFDLIFVPMQIWSKKQLARCLTLAPRLIWTLHDIISLRCNYLLEPERWTALKKAITVADDVVSISEYSHADTQAFFNVKFPANIIYHDPLENWISASISSKSILVIGNRYAHKAVNEALYFMRDFAEDVTVLGPTEAVPEFQQKGLPSGSLANSKIEELMAHAQVIVFPSLYEGFGYPAYEACFRGKTVIVHDNPLNRELESAGILTSVLYFDSFNKLPKLITEAKTSSLSPPGTLSKSMGKKYADLIKYRLDKKPNPTLLMARHEWLSENHELSL